MAGSRPSQAQEGLGGLITGLAEGYGSAMDQDAKLKQLYKQQLMKLQSPGMGLGGRAAASLIGGLLSPAEKNRLDSFENFIPLHNQITDAIVALQAGNPNASAQVIRDFAARYPEAMGLAHADKIDLNSLTSIYDSLTRIGAIEQFKLQNGSNAMPTEEAVRHNQQTYPTGTEIANRSPAVPAKLNALTDTLALSTIEGPRKRIELYKTPQGGFMTPYHEGMYQQLSKKSEGFRSRLRRLPDYAMDEQGQMPVQGFSGAAPWGSSPVSKPAVSGGGMAGSPTDQNAAPKRPKTADEYQF